MKALVTSGMIVALSISANCYGANSTPLPKGCSTANIHYLHGNVVLDPKTDIQKPRVYLLYNNFTETFWFDHSDGYPAASAGWGSAIAPGKWSAILMNRGHFGLSCSMIAPGKRTSLLCQGVMKACELTTVKVPSDKGGYWLSENKSLADTLKTVKKRLVSD